MADDLCFRLMTGDGTLHTLCHEPGMPSKTTVYRWLATHADFRDKYARAKEASADEAADQVIAVANQVRDGDLEPDAGRVVIDALKWAAGKRKPKVYGDRIQSDVNVTVTLRDLVRESMGNGTVIDVTPKGLLTDDSAPEKTGGSGTRPPKPGDDR